MARTSHWPKTETPKPTTRAARALMSVIEPDRNGIELPFTIEVMGHERIVATNGHVMVAVSPEHWTGEQPDQPIANADALLENAQRTCSVGQADWRALVDAAKVALDMARDEHRSAVAEWREVRALLVEAHREAVTAWKAVRAEWKGSRCLAAHKARAAATAAKEMAAAAIRRHGPKPKPKPAVVPVSAPTSKGTPYLQAHYVVLLDRVLRACHAGPASVRWAGTRLKPVGVFDSNGVVVAVAMPWRMD